MKSVRVPLAWLRFLGDVIRDERLLIFLHDWRVTEVSLPLATRQTHPHLPDRDFAVFSHTRCLPLLRDQKKSSFFDPALRDLAQKRFQSWSAPRPPHRSTSSEDVVDNVNVYERWKETVFLCPPASSSSENDIDFDARQMAFPQLMGLFLRDPALDQRVYGAERVQRAVSTYAELLELARAKRDAAARRGDEGGEMLLTRRGQQELFEEMYDQEDLLPRPRSPAPTGLLVDVGAGDLSSGFHDLMAWFDLWWGWVKLRRRYRTSLSSRNGVLEEPAQHPVPTRSSHPVLDAFVKQKVVAPTHPMAAEDELPDLGDYSAESGTDLVWNVFPRCPRLAELPIHTNVDVMFLRHKFLTDLDAKKAEYRESLDYRVLAFEGNPLLWKEYATNARAWPNMRHPEFEEDDSRSVVPFSLQGLVLPFAIGRGSGSPAGDTEQRSGARPLFSITGGACGSLLPAKKRLRDLVASDYDKFLELSVVENLRIRKKLEDMDSFFPRCAEWPHCSARRAAMVENVAMFDQWRECILRTWHGFDENEKIVASPLHSRPGRATGAHDHAEEVEFLEGHQAAEDATRTAPAGVQHMFEVPSGPNSRAAFVSATVPQSAPAREQGRAQKQVARRIEKQQQVVPFDQDFVGGRVFNLVADAATAAGGYRLLQQRRMALSYNLSAVLDNISVNATGTIASAATKELTRRAASTGFPALKVRALAEAVASEVPVVGLSEVLGYFEEFLGYVWDPLALKIDAQGNDYDVWQSAYGDSDKDNDKDTDYEGDRPTTASSRPKLKSYEFDTVLLETQDLEKEHPLAMYDSPKEYYYGNLTEEFARRGYEECFCSINTPAFAEINCAFTRRNSFG